MDDATLIRRLTVALLRENAATRARIGTILEAADTGSALQLIAQHSPEVVVLDIKVPGTFPLRNGIDLLKRVKADYPATQIIMLTNHATNQYRVECMRLGATFFFDKSVEFDELPSAIDTLFQVAANAELHSRCQG